MKDESIANILTPEIMPDTGVSYKTQGTHRVGAYHILHHLMSGEWGLQEHDELMEEFLGRVLLNAARQGIVATRKNLPILRRQPNMRDSYSPPSPDDISRLLQLSGDWLTPDFDRLRARLDDIAPARWQFAITSTPPGFAPEEIRKEWVGVTLPVRGQQEPGVSVLGREAIELLKEKSPQGYKWWRNYYIDEARTQYPKIDPEGFPEYLANASWLVFDESCGEEQPPF
jgi:hypothetical protein